MFALFTLLVFFIGIMLGRYMKNINIHKNDSSKKVKSIEHTMRKSAESFKYIITETITYEDDTKEVIEYIGSTTVWRTYPEFKRCSTNIEYKLSDIYAKLKYLEKEK